MDIKSLIIGIFLVIGVIVGTATFTSDLIDTYGKSSGDLDNLTTIQEGRDLNKKAKDMEDQLSDISGDDIEGWAAYVGAAVNLGITVVTFPATLFGVITDVLGIFSGTLPGWFTLMINSIVIIVGVLLVYEFIFNRET